MTDRRQVTAASAARQFRFGAVVIVLAGLLTVLFSFLPWIRYAPTEETATLLRGWPGTLPDGLSYGGVSPALWTTILGAVVALCGVTLLTGAAASRAAGTVVAGLATAAADTGFVAVCYFAANPQVAFDLQPDRIGAEVFVSAAWGLWLAFLATLFGVVGALTALIMTVRGDGDKPVV